MWPSFDGGALAPFAREAIHSVFRRGLLSGPGSKAGDRPGPFRSNCACAPGKATAARFRSEPPTKFEPALHGVAIIRRE